MGAGIYIHIPFCTGKCFYCSFYSEVYNEKAAAKYIDAVKAEILGRPPEGAFSTLYIGGGTPTTIPPEQLASLIDCVFENSTLPEGAEVTVEANPGGLPGYGIGLLGDAGVNRFSAGAQSFDPGELRLIGRRHTPEDISAAVRYLRGSGARNINIDLIYALPGQSMDGWRANIEKAAGLRPEHISLYDLSVEDGTPLHREVAAGRMAKPPEEAQTEMYMLAVELLGDAGYSRYEISNFALPGYECKHNLNYWAAGGYAGYGAGATSCISGTRTNNICDVERYIDAVLAGKTATASCEKLSAEDIRREFVMLGLRTAAGIRLDEYGQRFGHGFMDAYGGAVDRLSKAGYITQDGSAVKLTKSGILVSNRVITEFF